MSSWSCHRRDTTELWSALIRRSSRRHSPPPPPNSRQPSLAQITNGQATGSCGRPNQEPRPKNRDVSAGTTLRSSGWTTVRQSVDIAWGAPPWSHSPSFARGARWCAEWLVAWLVLSCLGIAAARRASGRTDCQGERLEHERPRHTSCSLLLKESTSPLLLLDRQLRHAVNADKMVCRSSTDSGCSPFAARTLSCTASMSCVTRRALRGRRWPEDRGVCLAPCYSSVGRRSAF